MDNDNVTKNVKITNELVVVSPATCAAGLLPESCQNQLLMPECTSTHTAASHPIHEATKAPTALDVICGRGKRIQNHAGNRRFHQIIDTYRDRYLAASKTEKTPISFEVLNKIRSDGGSFLQLDPVTGIYQEVGDLIAREKISHALRTPRKDTPAVVKRKAARKKKQANANECSSVVCDELLRKQRQIFHELVSARENGNHEIEGTVPNHGDREQPF